MLSLWVGTQVEFFGRQLRERLRQVEKGRVSQRQKEKGRGWQGQVEAVRGRKGSW